MTAARLVAEPGNDPAVVRLVRDAKEFCRLLGTRGLRPLRLLPQDSSLGVHTSIENRQAVPGS
jgi:hypothetical protein